MQYFRTDKEPETSDITRNPSYAGLNDEERKEVNEVYRTVFENNHRFGIRIALGMAYTAASQICESNSKYPEVVAASKKAWKATERARKTQHISDHESAAKAHDEAFQQMQSGTSAWKGHAEQAGLHRQIAAAKKTNEAETAGPEYQRGKGFPSGSLGEAEKVHPRVHAVLRGIAHEDLTTAEKAMMAGRHPSKALGGIAYDDLTTAERHIADHFGTHKGKRGIGEASGSIHEAEDDPEQDAGARSIEDKNVKDRQEYCEKCGSIHRKSEPCLSTGDNKEEKDKHDKDAFDKEVIHGAADVLSKAQTGKNFHKFKVKESEWQAAIDEIEKKEEDSEGGPGPYCGESEINELDISNPSSRNPKKDISYQATMTSPFKKKKRKSNWKDLVYQDLGMHKYKRDGKTYYESSEGKRFTEDGTQLLTEVRESEPWKACPQCNGAKHVGGRPCRRCEGQGSVTKSAGNAYAKGSLSRNATEDENVKEAASDPTISAAANYISYRIACAGTGNIISESVITEGVEEHEKFKDHTKNPFHKLLTQHGFEHKSTEHKKNRFNKDNPKADYTEHVYTHPKHGKSEVVVTQYHSKGGGGYVRSDDKETEFLHRHEQDNKIISPSSGNSKPQLHRSLCNHYGIPEGMDAPRLTAWEKRYKNLAGK